MARFDTVMSDGVHLKATVKKLQDDSAKAVQERDAAAQVILLSTRAMNASCSTM
jgi:hypothetical protein